jgi:L-ascorbate metabolism protein UlaG (beta-lactamase superfamily)
MIETWRENARKYALFNFEAMNRRIFGEAAAATDDFVWLSSPSGYVLKTAGVIWGVDLRAYQNARFSPEELSLLDFLLITHRHSDHYDETVLAALTGSKTKLVLPDFIGENERVFKENGASVIRIGAGEEITLSGIKIRAFESLHFRKDGVRGTAELGYHVFTGGKSLLFPADVRNYDVSRLPGLRADTVFAHVWLGEEMADKPPDFETVRSFGEFYTAFRPSRVFLAHLYDTGRKPSEMWRYEHAGLAADAILGLAPETDVVVPRLGRKYPLFS